MHGSVQVDKVIRSQGPVTLERRIPVQELLAGEKTLALSIAPADGVAYLVLEVWRTADPEGARTTAFFNPAQAVQLREALLAAERSGASEALVRLSAIIEGDAG